MPALSRWRLHLFSWIHQKLDRIPMKTRHAGTRRPREGSTTQNFHAGYRHGRCHGIWKKNGAAGPRKWVGTSTMKAPERGTRSLAGPGRPRRPGSRPAQQYYDGVLKIRVDRPDLRLKCPHGQEDAFPACMMGITGRGEGEGNTGFRMERAADSDYPARMVGVAMIFARSDRGLSGA